MRRHLERTRDAPRRGHPRRLAQRALNPPAVAGQVRHRTGLKLGKFRLAAGVNPELDK